MSSAAAYRESLRPQFHFTPRTNWTNDPNGLVFYAGEYHLFFQHNPRSTEWGNMTWGHAVGPDLIHWRQLDHALWPDELGTIFSGSAVVDWHDTTGFAAGAQPAIVCIYTSAGSEARPPRPFTQSIACSTDRGRTFTKYEGNPVLGHVRGANRDPKVIWHEPSGQWVMALYLDGNDYALFGSPDLKAWHHLSDHTIPGAGECPDFFPLAVDGDPGCVLWVFWCANGTYQLGSFDGTRFVPGTGVLTAESGPNGYAAQTWSDVPAADGRRLQISWMNGGRYPGMPFNQQMSFPVALSLRALEDGIRLCRQPVAEIAALYAGQETWADRDLAADGPLVPAGAGELLDAEMEVEPRGCHSIGLQVYGVEIRYDVARQELRYGERAASVRLRHGRLGLRLLLDRTSVEVFAQRGEASMSICLLPEAGVPRLGISAQGGTARLLSLSVRRLHSVWEG